jgi:hypothetical protein
LAFNIAEELKIPDKFKKGKKMTEEDFYYDFMKWQPLLSLKTPKSMSLMPAVGFSKSAFFCMG